MSVPARTRASDSQSQRGYPASAIAARTCAAREGAAGRGRGWPSRRVGHGGQEGERVRVWADSRGVLECASWREVSAR